MKSLINVLILIAMSGLAGAGEMETAAAGARFGGLDISAAREMNLPAPRAAAAADRLNPAEFNRISAVTRNATDILIDRQSSRDQIPVEILNDARCIAAVRIGQGGFIFGGGGGAGMVSCRLANGRWSAPSFLTFSQFSMGLFIGGSRIDMVLVFMAKTARQIMDHAQFSVGIDSELTAGPVGQHVSSAVGYESNILAYGSSVGLAANIVGLSGTLIAHFPARNAKVYSDLGLSQGRDVLALDGEQAPHLAAPYVATLNRLAPMK